MGVPKKVAKKKIEKEIIEFLESTAGLPDSNPGMDGCGLIHRTALVLATSYKDIPRATPLEFFHEGLTIYIFGEPGGKIANIKRNPVVCAAIYQQPLDHSRLQKSLQIFGKAEVINVRNNPRLFRAKAKKWNLSIVADKLFGAMLKEKGVAEKDMKKVIDELARAISLIKITPHRIIVREYHPGFSMPKYEWER